MEIRIARLHELFIYDPDLGHLYWKRARGRAAAGDRVGWLCEGYIKTNVDGVVRGAHRIAWAMTHGEWPDEEIDHINTIRSDNRIANLRKALPFQNCANVSAPKHNTSGIKGVSFHKASGKWRADIKVRGVARYLGLFLTKEEAAEAARAARIEAVGEFARH